MANVGDIQGGVVFYTGVSFSLVAAPVDVLMPRPWGCYKVAIDGTSTDIGLGGDNTNLIFSGCTGNTMIAANACIDFEYSGYTDWFLPSKDDLNEMYLHKDLAGIGEFDIYNNYWSSSQYDPETAWIQFFKDGTQSKGDKDQFYKVRPVRFLT